MGKPTGFMEYERHEASYRPVADRIQDWDEFIAPQDAETLRTQSARCMDCGVPFCHAGFVVNGQSIGCPISNLIPEINDLVYRGEIEKAYERLSKTHPFPEFTAHVCPALCEGSCTLGEHEPPVTIKEIERYVIDEMFRRGKVRPRIQKISTGKRVAIVGSGPAGLACADVLNQLGNSVTVFERSDRPGGLLMYGIPNMKLPKTLVTNRIRIMEEEGVRFVTGTHVGVDYSVLTLMQDFDAVVLCVGATLERRLQVPGAELFGVSTAMNFLTQSTKNLLDRGIIADHATATHATDRTTATLPDIAGKRVIVVGGGDTGTDCVATSIRQGAKSVTQLEIMPRPADERTKDNPWPLWPKIHKTDYGQLEAIELFGADPREYLTTVKEIVGDGQKVCGVRTVKVEWVHENGRLVPKEIPGTEQLRPADIVLTAMGFTGPERTLIDQLGLNTDARGNVLSHANEYRTNLMTVFASGDMRRGPSLVVWAIMEGRQAAKQCHRYLNAR